MRVLITGAAGFIGQHLHRELEQHGHDVIAVDREDGDIRKPGVATWLVFTRKPEVVVHLAAKVGRLFGEDDPAETVADNAGMTAYVAKACGTSGARLVYASTSEVYGDCGNDLCDENLPGVWFPDYDDDETGRVGVGWADPHNIYGLSKRWGEEVCRLYSSEGLTLLRLSMPYGPGHPPGRGRAALTNFLHQADTRQPIPVHRGAERSWCWVGDTVRAIRHTIERADHGTFNIGRDDDPRPMVDVAKLACDLTGAPHSLIEEVDPPERQTVVKRLATDKIRALGWKPEVELEEGMARTLEWLRALLPLAA